MIFAENQTCPGGKQGNLQKRPFGILHAGLFGEVCLHHAIVVLPDMSTAPFCPAPHCYVLFDAAFLITDCSRLHHLLFLCPYITLLFGRQACVSFLTQRHVQGTHSLTSMLPVSCLVSTIATCLLSPLIHTLPHPLVIVLLFPSYFHATCSRWLLL